MEVEGESMSLTNIIYKITDSLECSVVASAHSSVWHPVFIHVCVSVERSVRDSVRLSVRDFTWKLYETN